MSKGRPLGKEQIHLLCTLASPGRFLVVPNKRSASLVARGFLKSYSDNTDGFIGITAAGFRRLADEMEAGHLDAFTRLPVKPEPSP